MVFDFDLVCFIGYVVCLMYDLLIVVIMNFVLYVVVWLCWFVMYICNGGVVGCYVIDEVWGGYLWGGYLWGVYLWGVY